MQYRRRRVSVTGLSAAACPLGMSAKNSVSAAQKIGADACLEKPFTVKDVESALQTLGTA